ncbi:uncharacterized protein LOC131162016 [Malania oleifera]|uniref:uncharacterized protein LOC131162016 n=1 Tax=Malania oleifera TaxID=397392 RepID=UPI0025AE7B78|nr:uncharacterized protein LOC131162016 [Malania oleifera]
MGKGRSRRKQATSSGFQDDESALADPSDLKLAKRMEGVRLKDVELKMDHLLDESLEALFEKRASTREKAYSSIIQAFTRSFQYQFAQDNFDTLLQKCLSSIKRGSSKEISLASRAMGLISLTIGSGTYAQEILGESILIFSDALKSPSHSPNPSALVECLAIITFVGGKEPADAMASMKIMWQLVDTKRSSNVVETKPSAELIATTVSACSFLFTTMDEWGFKYWLESVSCFSAMLEKDDRSIRIAAGEALAVILETGNFGESLTDSPIHEVKNSLQGNAHIQSLWDKILNKVRDLSKEAANNKGSNKKNLKIQRNLFRDLLDFLEHGFCPETSMLIVDVPLNTTTWSEMIQLNYLKHFIGEGFLKHMQDNEFLHEIFDIVPKGRMLSAKDRGEFRKEKESNVGLPSGKWRSNDTEEADWSDDEESAHW